MVKMYKVLPIALLLFVCLQPESGAQTKIGTGAAWANGVEEFGYQINASFQTRFTNLRIAGDFSLFFVDDIRTLDQSFSEFNLNGHYEFLEISRFTVYGLGGINIGFFNLGIDIETNEPGRFLESTESETRVGLNTGGGFEIDVVALSLFAEGKYTINELDQAIFTAGIRFELGSGLPFE